jgi:alpha-tubulin suppressor-like RCC1 family protein
VKKVSAGDEHTCVLTEAGDVLCWGRGAEGQIGDGTGLARLAPTLVLSNAIDILATQYHTCAVTETHNVKCWGSNEWGTLGDGTFLSRPLPVDAVGVSDAIAIAGGATTYALLANGNVMYWGVSDMDGSSWGANGFKPTPVPFDALSGVRMIADGCALLVSGSVECWGINMYGEVGDGTTVSRALPVKLDLGGSAASIAASFYHHRCATLASGEARCWGRNDSGQLGDGTTVERHQPTPVIGITGVISVSAGGQSGAVADDGRGVKCWGSNINGGLGNGTTIPSSLPTSVVGLP